MLGVWLYGGNCLHGCTEELVDWPVLLLTLSAATGGRAAPAAVFGPLGYCRRCSEYAGGARVAASISARKLSIHSSRELYLNSVESGDVRHVEKELSRVVLLVNVSTSYESKMVQWECMLNRQDWL